MESRLRKASSAGILSNNVIRVILHSERRTKGKMSVENIAKHAGTVTDTLFCAVGSVGSLELPLAQAGFYKGTSTAQGTHHHQQRTSKPEECLHTNHIQLVKYRIYLNKNFIVMIKQQNLHLVFKTTEPWPCWLSHLEKSKWLSTIKSTSHLLQPEGYPANTPIPAGLQGLCVELWLLKRLSCIEAAPVRACIADLIHMVLTHMLCNISTACLICFPAESPERDRCQKTNLSVLSSASSETSWTSASSCTTSRLSFSHTLYLFFSCHLFLHSFLCVLLCLYFLPAFFPFSLHRSLSPSLSLPCDLLLGEVWVFGQASPGRACLVTAVLPSDKALHCDG